MRLVNVIERPQHPVFSQDGGVGEQLLGRNPAHVKLCYERPQASSALGDALLRDRERRHRVDGTQELRLLTLQDRNIVPRQKLNQPTQHGRLQSRVIGGTNSGSGAPPLKRPQPTKKAHQRPFEWHFIAHHLYVNELRQALPWRGDNHDRLGQ